MTDVFRSDTSSFFVMILAIVGITGEWRHRTITSSLLAAPNRMRFLAAKFLAFAAAGALLSLTISVAVAVIGFTILEARDLPTPGVGEVLEQSALNMLVAALLGALGVGIGALVRNQPIAIVGVLIFSFMVDPLLAEFAPKVERWSPIGSLSPAAQGYEPEDVDTTKVDFFAPAVAAMLLLGWIGALYAAGAAMLRRRDVE